MKGLREFTPARVAIGRTGHSVPTAELLDFQLAHARARDAVHSRLDVTAFVLEIKSIPALSTLNVLTVRSAANDRSTYLRRPDLGRLLDSESASRIAAAKGTFDAAIVIADGLSALALQRHAAAVLDALFPRLDAWALAPIVVVEQGRVAAGDDIAQRLGAPLAAILIGERPGLSAPDSLGCYITWNPQPGITTDADRNCVSNIRPGGLTYSLAAHKIAYLMTEARNREISGVCLKEDAPALSGCNPNDRSTSTYNRLQ